MSTNEQNGRQQTDPQQAAPPSDPRLRNSNASSSDREDGVCRDYVWGICSKGNQCKYRHVLNPESMKNILKFCHNYQNRGCSGQGCTYLHTTREEESLFLSTGLIPKVLRDRYAAANMFMNDFVNQPPPPPPPPPSLNVLQVAASQPPPPPTMLQVARAPPPPLPSSLPALLAAPPPPPPPPTVSTACTAITPPVFTAPHTVNPVIATTTAAAFPVDQELHSLVNFDASKPPPPLPILSTKNGAVKRPAETAEAGPSKTRKQEIEHSICKCCIQRELRVGVLQTEIEKLACEHDCQTFVLQKRSESFAHGKLLLKSAVSPDLFHILETYIEASTPMEQVSDAVMSHMSSSTSSPLSSSLHNQNLDSFMELARNFVEAPHTSVFGSGPEWTKQKFLERLQSAITAQNTSSSVNGIINGTTASPLPGATPRYTNPMSSTSTLPSTSAQVPNRIPVQSVIEKRNPTQKRVNTQTASQNAVIAQARNAVQSGSNSQIAVHPPDQPFVKHQPNLTYAPNVPQRHLQNGPHIPNHSQNGPPQAQNQLSNGPHLQNPLQNGPHIHTVQTHLQNGQHLQNHSQNGQHLQNHSQNGQHLQNHPQSGRHLQNLSQNGHLQNHSQNGQHLQNHLQNGQHLQNHLQNGQHLQNHLQNGQHLQSHLQNGQHLQNHLQNVPHSQNVPQLQTASQKNPLQHTQRPAQQNSTQAQTTATVNYSPYQLTAPPPPRAYYPQYAPAPSNVRTAYNPPVRAVSATAVVSSRASTTATTQHYPYIPRFPHSYHPP